MLHQTLGMVANRLVVGFVFAFIYQAITGIATSALGIPLTGTIQDLLLGIQQADQDIGVGAIIWWVVSSVLFTLMATHLVRFRRYISPYRKEKGMDVPPDITLVSLLIMGAAMSAIFFLLDLTIGATQGDAVSDVHTIYYSAMSGNFVPLSISLLYSMVAGSVVVWVIGRAAKVKEMTRGIGEISDLRDKFRKEGTGQTIADTRGMAPGTLVHVGIKKVDKVWYSSMRYGPDHLDELPRSYELSECLEREKHDVNWLGMTGMHDAEAVRQMGDVLGLHELYQADIMNTHMRPSLNMEEDRIFITVKMPLLDDDDNLVIEHVGLVLDDTYVVSFQEADGDVFDRVRENIRHSQGRFRNAGNDYLVYALIDAIVDNFFVIMEKIGKQTEDLEHRLISNPGPQELEAVYTIKRQLINLRKIIWPMREVINNLERNDSPLIQSETRRYLRDVYSHAIQTMDTLESLRDMVGGMLDTYLSSISNRTNEVMKTLTIIASIFIPITFIAGLYGTNFAYVPELELEGGYFVMLGIMGAISASMLVWFRRKSWL